MSILVVDVGTTTVRAAVVHPDATVTAVHARAFPPSTPFPGLVELDAAALGDLVIELASASLAEAGPVDAVGVANQRCSTIVWDRVTGQPVAPGLGWQDLRTVGECLVLGAEGYRMAPNQSATKLPAIVATVPDAAERDLAYGTVDSWVAWVLSGGDLHVTDLTNAAVSGLLAPHSQGWHTPLLDRLGIDEAWLPTVVDSSGILGPARALPGAPPLAALAGDQQASLIGQGCVRPGQAKATFGTGAMLDVCLGPEPPTHMERGPHGTFPIVAWRMGGATVWGVEAIMLSAGTNVEWLVEDLGVLDSPAASHEVAAACADTDGVVYVPALLGLGTPYWDYGARGTLLGVTRGTGRPQLVRAVLEGVAQRGADLLEAAEADAGVSIEALRVDGGMSANPTFVQAVADATGRPVEVSPVLEATTLGAGYLAGLAVGTWASLDEAAGTWAPAVRVEPGGRLDRQRWARAVERAAAWVPDLSAIDF